MDGGNEHDGSMPSVLSSMLTADEVNLIKFYRGFPDSEKKTVLIEFETKFKKYNQLFAELLASRK
ncbi:transcriptional repressor DicA domain protein [Klebsiella sp. AS10]|nr:transcriptional repressor DicA domain protein [Klebsiella sp. AS10]